MGLSPIQSPKARSFFVVPYLVGAGAALAPQIPQVCPEQEALGGLCALGIHHHRRRQTGSVEFLVVLRCRRHGRCFTLYPPGYGPYLRRPVVDLTPEGHKIEHEHEHGRRLDDFKRTLFAAALSANDAQSWPRNSWIEAGASSWMTQRRHLELGCRLLGLSGSLDNATRVRIAEALGLRTSDLIEGAKTISGYRSQGEWICRLLTAIPLAARGARRLLQCGHLAGLWGMPLHWDGHHLQRPRFQNPDTTSPP